MRVEHAPGSGSVPTFRPPRSVAAVTRQLEYHADKTFEGTIDAQDVRRNGKLAKGLLAIAGRTSLDNSALRGVVQRFAGSDDIVSEREFRALAAAVSRTTSSMPDTVDFPPPPVPDLAGAAHAMVQVADANHDGIVDQADVEDERADMAASLLEVAGRTRVTEQELAQVIDAFVDPWLPDAPQSDRIKAFVLATYGKLQEKAGAGLSVADLGRAGVAVFDRDQDQLLERSDGHMAQITLRDAGKTTARAHDIANLYRKYDTEDPAGAPGHDGRLNSRELNRMLDAQRAGTR